MERTEDVYRITKTILEDIDKTTIQGNGNMILLRVLKKKDGMFFTEILRKMPKFLHLDNAFSVVLDIEPDDIKIHNYGLYNFNNEEVQFLERLQLWNDIGNANFRPSAYTDLHNHSL